MTFLSSIIGEHINAIVGQQVIGMLVVILSERTAVKHAFHEGLHVPTRQLKIFNFNYFHKKIVLSSLRHVIKNVKPSACLWSRTIVRKMETENEKYKLNVGDTILKIAWQRRVPRNTIYRLLWYAFLFRNFSFRHDAFRMLFSFYPK